MKAADLEEQELAALSRNLLLAVQSEAASLPSRLTSDIVESAVFGADRPIYCRVTALVTRTPRVYLASLGNLLEGCATLAVLRCPRNVLEAMVTEGCMVEALHPSRLSRGPSVHCSRHACEHAGATVIASVPIFSPAAESEGPAPQAIGVLTYAWKADVADALRHVPTMQALARHLEVGFAEAVQRAVQEAATYFLQDLAPQAPKPATPEEPGPSDPCQEDRPDHDPAPSSSSSLAIPVQNPHVPDANATPMEEEDVFAFDEKKLMSGSSSGTCLTAESGTLAVPPGFKDAVNPFWLTFKDAALEKQFCLSQAVAYLKADLSVDVILIAANILFYNPVTSTGLGPVPALTVVLSHLLSLCFKTSWYSRHRSTMCILFATLIPISLAIIIPRALQSPLVTQELLKPLATREMLVMPGIHVLVCLGHRIEFWKATLFRAPVAILACLYASVCMGLRAWDLSVLETVAWMAIPAVVTYAGALYFVHIEETKERKNFYAVNWSRGSRPGARLGSRPTTVA